MKFIPHKKVTRQKYYDRKTKEEDEKKMERANNIWLSFNSPLCSHQGCDFYGISFIVTVYRKA